MNDRQRVPWEDAVTAAAQQIRTGGIASLDLGQIAHDLAVEREAVTYWFTDEVEVLLSVMQIRQRWFLDEADMRLGRLDTNTEKIAELLDLCVADHDVTYWIELWKVGLRDERARVARQTLVGAYRDLFARLIRAGQRSGEFAAVSPDQVALVLVAMVTGLAVDCTVGGPERADAMHEILVDATERLLEIKLG
jgi:AcrR family transcriptional regulator